jgi:hypothetical protein
MKNSDYQDQETPDSPAQMFSEIGITLSKLAEKIFDKIRSEIESISDLGNPGKIEL